MKCDFITMGFIKFLAVAGFSVGDIGIPGLGIIDDMGFDSFLLLW